MKTIQIPDEIYDKLIKLADEYVNQNNRSTADPLYFSIEQMIPYPCPEDEGDFNAYYNCDGGCIRDIEDAESYIDEDDQETFEDLCDKRIELDSDEFDEFMSDCLPEFRKLSMKYEPVYKNCFLTAKSCDEHLQLNYYHYNIKARSYAETAWRNPDMEIMVKLLRTLGKVKEK
jgi:hypothetical protein